MNNLCECKNNKKYKYIQTLLHPETSRCTKLPSRMPTPTTVFKRRRQIEFQPNSTGNLSVQWSPQAFYFSNMGIFTYNQTGYNGISTTSATTSGFGIDNTGFVPTGTPIRLVGASMEIIYGGGSLTWGSGGIFTGCSYETTISTGVADQNMSYFSQIGNIKNVKTVSASNGLRIIYVPYDMSCSNFYGLNTNLGLNGDLNNGMNMTQRLVFYGNELPQSITCIQIIFTQIFEAVTSSDYFNCYPNTYLQWEPNEMIKKYITDRNYYVMSLKEANCIEEKLNSYIVEECNENMQCCTNMKCCKSMTFFRPDKLREIRLPSFFGETTSLFYQKNSKLITTNSDGIFYLQWLPQFFHTSLDNSMTGIYLANNSGYNGISGAVPIGETFLDFGNFNNGNVFSKVRLVSACMKIIFIGQVQNLNGNFIGGVELAYPLTTLPNGNNYTYSNIGNMTINKDVKSGEGLKIVYVPYDYSCFKFYSPNYLISSNIPSTICQTFNVCGYGLSGSTQCIRVVCERVFEGIANSAYSDYYDIESSNIDKNKCDEMTIKIVNNDLILSKINEEKININKLK
jgi:hypothetical protein